jgi:hypothetical protein
MTDTAAPDVSTEVVAATRKAVEALPHPDVVRRYLTDRLAERVAEARAARRTDGDDDGTGDALGPDEVRDLALNLTEVHDGLHAYGAAFEGAAQTARQYLGEEQRAAFGVDDGEPCESLHLLDDDGATVTVADRTAGAGWACSDLDSLYEGVAMLTLGEHSEALTAQGIPETAEAGAVIEAVVIAALRRLVAAGKFEPQVTKVKGKGKLADEVARVDRKVAARIRASMYRDPGRVTGTTVKITREDA